MECNIEFNILDNKTHLKVLERIVGELGTIEPVTRKVVNRSMLNDETKEVVSVTIMLPKNFLKIFPMPKDCQALALAHMSHSILQIINNDKASDWGIEEKDKLFKLFTIYLYEALKSGFKLESNLDYMKKWKEKAKKYKNNQKVREQLFAVIYFINLIQSTIEVAN